MPTEEQKYEEALTRLSSRVGENRDGKRRLSKMFASSSGSERRAYERKEDRFPVELELASGERCVAHVTNLSQRGLRLEIADEEPGIREGDTVKVFLTSPFLEAQAVRVIRDFTVLACKKQASDVLQLRLQSVEGDAEAEAESPGLNPHEFVLTPELEDFFLQLQAQLKLQLPQRDSKVVVFTAADWGCGASTISWWYAVSLARKSSKRVLFIDANVLAKARGADAGPAGFVDLLLGKATMEDTVFRLSVGAPDLLNVGRVNQETSGEIGLSDVNTTFNLLREHYDYVIVDASPAVASSATMLWAQCADGCMLVLASGETQRDLAQSAVVRLRHAGAKVLGAVLNRVKL